MMLTARLFRHAATLMLMGGLWVHGLAIATPTYVLKSTLTMPVGAISAGLVGLNKAGQSAGVVTTRSTGIFASTKTGGYLLSAAKPVALPMPLFNGPSLSAINEQGAVAGKACIPVPLNCSGQAAVWRNGKYTALGAGTGSWATGINNNGAVVGAKEVSASSTSNGSVRKTFVWTNGTLKWLSLPELVNPSATGMSDDGTVMLLVGGASLQTYLWKSGVLTKIEQPGLSSIIGTAMSSDGRVAGVLTVDGSGGQSVFVYQAGSLILLPAVTSGGNGSLQINALGQVLMGPQWLWHQGQWYAMADLIPGLPGQAVRGVAINDVGDILAQVGSKYLVYRMSTP